MLLRSQVLSAAIVLMLWVGLCPAQDSSAPPASAPTQTPAPAPATPPPAASAQTPSVKKTPAPRKSPSKSSAKRKTPSRGRTKARKPLSLRARRVQKAFVASADLKFMAAQLLANRSRAAYAGVESYGRRHAHDEAGGLAWLVLGYAHTLDSQWEPAVEALRQAKARGGELDDYTDYLLGQSYVAEHAYGDALKALDGFKTRHADSLFVRDAALAQAEALVGLNHGDDAAALLETERLPARPDLEMLLGEIYAQQGKDMKAAEAWRTVYYGMPMSPQADEVETRLKALTAKGRLPAVAWDKRKTRADLLAKGRQWTEAASEYRELLGEAPGEQVADVQEALGDALYHAGRERDARDVLERVPETAPSYADALHDLAEMEHGDHDRYLQLLDKLRQTAPTSLALQQSLMSNGNSYLIQHNLEEALRFYQEIYQRAPQGKLASYAHWKAAWLTYRLGRLPEAAHLFEEQLAMYPAGNEAPDAIYWRARLSEQEGNPARARNWYVKLVQRFPLYYYAELARARIREMKVPADAAADPEPLLEKIPPTTAPEGFDAALPEEDPRAQKAMLLENCGMFDFAIRELQAAMNGGEANWAAREIARAYQDSDRDYRALQSLKRFVPNYSALDLGALPKTIWEPLFPRAYWPEVKRFSADNKLDPNLVSSLIRQESEFNPVAQSRANAIGLMQLLPKVGRTLARQEKIRHYSTNMLLEPNVNIQLGTRYFAQLLEKYGGVPEYALAAYNAGTDRVDDWRSAGPYRDTAEFVESIPFTETREYVQAIVRNAGVYRRLYGEQNN